MMVVIKSPSHFDDWFFAARKGDAAVYYEGFLMRERMKTEYKREGAGGPDWLQIALKAWGAYLTRRVILYQKKIDIGHYVYIIKRV